VRKWSEEIDLSAHKLITVPGGSDGPSGVLVCSENYITWMHPDYSSIRIPIPRRPELYDINQDLQNGVKEEKGIIVIASVVHRLKNGFFVLVQTERGDVFKITMDYTPGTDGFSNGVDALRIKYFDTLPPSSSLILLKSGFLFAASEFGNQYVIFSDI
jgi:splicing factor 3B subunit 3